MQKIGVLVCLWVISFCAFADEITIPGYTPPDGNNSATSSNSVPAEVAPATTPSSAPSTATTSKTPPPPSPAEIAMKMMNATDLTAWGLYAKSLATCTPGIFKLPNIDVLAMAQKALMSNPGLANSATDTQTKTQDLLDAAYSIYTIVGAQNGKCEVTIKGNLSFRCFLSSADLQTAVDAANSAASTDTSTVLANRIKAAGNEKIIETTPPGCKIDPLLNS